MKHFRELLKLAEKVVTVFLFIVAVGVIAIMAGIYRIAQCSSYGVKSWLK